MNPNRQPLYKPIYYLQRPESPKSTIQQAQSSKNLSLTMSIGANQSPPTFFPLPKSKQEQHQLSSTENGSSTPADRY
jgi:hypothetical protein